MEEPEFEIVYYWVVCATSGCKVENKLFENIIYLSNVEGHKIICAHCKQVMTDIGPMETLEERKSRPL